MCCYLDVLNSDNFNAVATVAINFITAPYSLTKEINISDAILIVIISKQDFYIGIRNGFYNGLCKIEISVSASRIAAVFLK